MAKKVLVELNLRELNDLYYEISTAITSCEDRGYHKIDSGDFFKKHYKNLVSLKDKIGTALDTLVMKP